MKGIEQEEEESRYAEAAAKQARRLSSDVLRAPIARLGLHPATTVREDASAGDAIAEMQRRGIGSILVVDKAGMIAGIFTERDVLKKVAGKPLDLVKSKVRDLMTPKPETIRAEDRMGFALNKMTVGGYRHIPVVDKAGKPTGVLTMRDVVRYIVEFFPEDVLNQPPKSSGRADEPDGG
ncbi:MAG: CBS domain-containing protein [Planctomycetales bacterium]|nr:CBS domain-containing protein [Planctomycetales bacterium]